MATYIVCVDLGQELYVEVTGANDEMEARKAAFQAVQLTPFVDERAIKDLTEVIPISDKVNLPEQDIIRRVLREIKSEASDMLGDLGCGLIGFAMDKILEKCSLSEEEIKKIKSRLAVGVSYELEEENG
jgi:hypothetical protein